MKASKGEEECESGKSVSAKSEVGRAERLGYECVEANEGVSVMTVMTRNGCL